jgi:hypothetical protein
LLGPRKRATNRDVDTQEIARSYLLDERYDVVADWIKLLQTTPPEGGHLHA